jgi:hypothetical protein
MAELAMELSSMITEIKGIVLEVSETAKDLQHNIQAAR